MESIIKELWHGNIIPQEDSRTNSKEMKEILGYMGAGGGIFSLRSKIFASLKCVLPVPYGKRFSRPPRYTRCARGVRRYAPRLRTTSITKNKNRQP